MFNPDKPIENIVEDLLGRADFSRSFGKAILAYNKKDSIVTALYGGWGSGKSSVINMAFEIIEDQIQNYEKDEKPIIVRFNPWNYSDQSYLTALFFKELSYALRREDYGEKVEEVGKKLEVYSHFFTPLALIPDLTVSAFLLFIQKIFSSVGKTAKAWSVVYSKDLEATRNELNELLEKQERKIIIVIDDIDRLNNDEIRQIFQLVKILGDFPNTIYVLAFDQGVVTKALEKVQEGPGDDYLEKIVQFPIQLPLVRKSDLEKSLFQFLNELIKEIPKEQWDSTYWENIYYNGVRNYFNTMRDVTRFINSLKFSFGMVRNEVNVIDFIVLTVIQLFEPTLYAGIRDNKDLFVGILEHSHTSEKARQEKMLARLNEILNHATQLSKEQFVNFLIILFPKLEELYGNIDHGRGWLDSWRKDLRICSPEIFDTYFMLAIPSDEISKSEMTSILDIASDLEAFKDTLIKLSHDKRIVRFLDLLQDYTQEDIPEESIPNIVQVLMDIGDLFPDRYEGFFGFDTPNMILRIFLQLSLRFENQSERHDLFRTAIERATNSIYTIVFKVGRLSGDHGKDLEKYQEKLKLEDKREISMEQAQDLIQLAVSKIAIWADSGRLASHPRLIIILYCWKRWNKDNRDVTKEFVKSLIQTDEGLIKFIMAIASKFITAIEGKPNSLSASDIVTKTNLKISLRNIKDFIEVEEIEPRIRQIVNSEQYDELKNNQKAALQVFLGTYDGKVDDW